MQQKHALVVMSLAFVAAGSLSATGPLARDGSPKVVASVVALKEVVRIDAAGHQTVLLEPAVSTGPGDTLIYRIVYRNEGTAPAHDAEIVDPIPTGTQLVPGSWDTRGGVFAVSVDGGKSFEPYPARRAVRLADGSTAMQDAAIAQYTHVRWTTHEPLAAGAERTTAFKVMVR